MPKKEYQPGKLNPAQSAYQRISGLYDLPTLETLAFGGGKGTVLADGTRIIVWKYADVHRTSIVGLNNTILVGVNTFQQGEPVYEVGVKRINESDFEVKFMVTGAGLQSLAIPNVDVAIGRSTAPMFAHQIKIDLGTTSAPQQSLSGFRKGSKPLVDWLFGIIEQGSYSRPPINLKAPQG